LHQEAFLLQNRAVQDKVALTVLMLLIETVQVMVAVVQELLFYQVPELQVTVQAEQLGSFGELEDYSLQRKLEIINYNFLS
jgi:hypothetical protein